MPMQFDAQAALGFVISQTAHVETAVYQTQYPEIRYSRMMYVDRSAHPMAQTVEYRSADMYGKADWINGNSDDIPKAGTNMAKNQVPIYTAGIGYGWGWEEVQTAQMLGRNLPADDAMAARRAYEEMVDRVALFGDTSKGFEGLYDNSSVTANAATNGGWENATPLQILKDINDAIGNVFTATNTVGIADTLVLPNSRWNLIASTPMSVDNPRTILSYIRENNIYTARTGLPLTLYGDRGLDDIGDESPVTTRMIAYRNNRDVVRIHIPMPLRFMPVYQSGPLRWDVPGVFRLGGVDIRLPKEVTYVDGI